MPANQFIHPVKSFHKPLLRVAVVALGMLVVSVFAFASKGGGEKKKLAEFDSPFTPINSASSFSLRKSPAMYSGSMSSLGSFRTVSETRETRVSLSPLITTYQKGNTTLILPFQYQPQMANMSGNGGKSSLQLFGVKIQMPR